MFPADLGHFARARTTLGLSARCKGCIAAYHKSYAGAHPDKIRANVKRWQAKNRAKVAEIRERWYQANKDHAKEYQRRYIAEHPEANRVGHAARKARKLASGGHYTRLDVIEQLKRQRGRCYWCRKGVTVYHVDHVVPLSKGGSNDKANIVIACAPCNQRKGAKSPHDFVPSDGQLRLA